MARPRLEQPWRHGCWSVRVGAAVLSFTSWAAGDSVSSSDHGQASAELGLGSPSTRGEGLHLHVTSTCRVAPGPSGEIARTRALHFLGVGCREGLQAGLCTAPGFQGACHCDPQPEEWVCLSCSSCNCSIKNENNSESSFPHILGDV